MTDDIDESEPTPGEWNKWRAKRAHEVERRRRRRQVVREARGGPLTLDDLLDLGEPGAWIVGAFPGPEAPAHLRGAVVPATLLGYSTTGSRLSFRREDTGDVIAAFNCPGRGRIARVEELEGEAARPWRGDEDTPIKRPTFLGGVLFEYRIAVRVRPWVWPIPIPAPAPLLEGLPLLPLFSTTKGKR